MNVCTRYFLWWKIHKSIKRIAPCYRGLVSLEAHQPVDHMCYSQLLPPLVQEGDCSPFLLDSYATENKNSTRKVDTPSMRPMSSLGNGSEFYKPPPLKKMILMTKTADRQTTWPTPFSVCSNYQR